MNIIEKGERLKRAEEAYGNFLSALGYDWMNNVQMKETPYRVAKMTMTELCRGDYEDMPKITTFDNDGSYDGMVFQGNIIVKSMCAHHMLPFIGRAHVAYIPLPKSKIIGLSKLNRIVDWYARRPQLQETLTMQIHDKINEITKENLGVAVMTEAQHMCVYLRGIEHDSMMKTAKLSGVFLNKEKNARDEFYQFIGDLKKR